MLFADPAESRFAQTFVRYLFLNPFHHTEGDVLRRQLLDLDLGLGDTVVRQSPIESSRPEIIRLAQVLDAFLVRLHERISGGCGVSGFDEQRQLESLILGSLFYRHFESRRPLQEAAEGSRKVSSYRRFARDAAHWQGVPIAFSPFLRASAHMFAVFYQLRRSFERINELVRGNSRPINRLRAEIWHSIFPHELQLYGSLLYDRMHDITTLILGPSGTGKDLVAMAIGLSRYVAFDPGQERFTEPETGAFHPLNLSAMPGDLIESEMFGHCAGAFTGATRDRQGWFERCLRGHTVFLDEIGELPPLIQVKLLRVLQNREFVRVGETEPREFTGKVIAATNRQIDLEIAAGRFRQDLFYRLCSDVLTTPSLREQLDDTPEELSHLVRIVAARCLGDRAWPEQIDWLSGLALGWIESCPDLGPYYDWPGNFRELEQCVRNIMVRGRYLPPRRSIVADPVTATRIDASNPAMDAFLKRIRAADLTYDELLNFYCSLVYSRSGHLTAAARSLKKHRSTVESRVQPELVAAFLEAGRQTGVG